MKKVVGPKSLLKHIEPESYILVFEESVGRSMTSDKAINCSAAADFDVVSVVPPKSKTRKKYSKHKANNRRKLASASRKRNR